MAHAQKPDFVFRRNGRVHLNRQGTQFSRLLAAEVCASAVVMLHTPCSEVVWRVLATQSIRQFPLHFPSRASPSAITLELDSTVFRLMSELPTPGLLSLSGPLLSLFWAETLPERNEKIRILIDVNWQSLSWEVGSFSGGKDISFIMWKPKVHYHIHNSTPLVSVMSRYIRSTPSQPVF
jgi:hypothetical protein